MSRAATVPVVWISRSASVDLPWSIWATMEKLRILSIVWVVMRAGIAARGREGKGDLTAATAAWFLRPRLLQAESRGNDPCSARARRAAFAAAPVHAQSFDCAEARTVVVERLVCADQRLGRPRTRSSAPQVKASLAADPRRKREIFAEARQWLMRARPPRRQPARRARSPREARAIACLVAAYGTRTAALQRRLRAMRATALCRTLGERYRCRPRAIPGAVPDVILCGEPARGADEARAPASRSPRA